VPDILARGAGVPESFIAHVSSIFSKSLDFFLRTACGVGLRQITYAVIGRMMRPPRGAADFRRSSCICWSSDHDCELSFAVSKGPTRRRCVFRSKWASDSVNQWAPTRAASGPPIPV